MVRLPSVRALATAPPRRRRPFLPRPIFGAAMDVLFTSAVPHKRSVASRAPAACLGQERSSTSGAVRHLCRAVARPDHRERHTEAPHTGSLVAVDTFFVGTLKGVGKVYLQTAVDCHSRHG